MRRGRTKQHYHAWTQHGELRVEPRPARLHLRVVRLLVNASLSARRSFPLEVLHDVGDVDLRAVYSCFVEGLTEHLSSGSDERLAREIFVVARLLPHEHDLRGGPALSEHRLRSSAPQVAGAALARRLLETRERSAGRKILRGRAELRRRLEAYRSRRWYAFYQLCSRNAFSAGMLLRHGFAEAGLRATCEVQASSPRSRRL